MLTSRNISCEIGSQRRRLYPSICLSDYLRKRPIVTAFCCRSYCLLQCLKVVPLCCFREELRASIKFSLKDDPVISLLKLIEVKVFEHFLRFEKTIVVVN